jgi:hypothetical protein
MGREFIGECPCSGEDPQMDDCETELTIKYIKQECGPLPRGVNVEVTLEGHELGSYPVISVVWEDSIVDYPDEYIGKCMEAFERFDLPEEIRQQYELLFEVQREIEKASERIFEALNRKRSEET